MDDEKFKNYMQDLGLLLKEKARDAKIQKKQSVDENDASYKLGYLMAFYEVISIMKQQADVFNIEQKDICLEDVDPETELL